MSPLANAIYQILRAQVPSEDGRINYQRMVEQLPAQHGITSPNDARLNSAYSEITDACRQNGLPAIMAILVRLDENGELGTPGPGYYPAAHPGMNRADAFIAWALEYEQARLTVYPETLV